MHKFAYGLRMVSVVSTILPREHFRKFHMKPKKNDKVKNGLYEFDHENTLKFANFKAKKLIFGAEKIKFKNFILSQIVWEAFL